MQNRKGFTIIELLVVVGIIGLLASLAVVSFGSAQQRARDGKRVADMRSVLSALSAVALSETNPIICKGTLVLPAGQTQLSTVTICTSATCAGCSGASDVTAKYVNLANLHDPSNNTAACANPAVALCDYGMQAGATIANQTAAFKINFWTESANVAGLGAGNAHVASETGSQ